MDSYFLAIPLPSTVRSRLSTFCYGLPQTRWNEEENFHLTLRYFGPIADSLVSQIHEQLENLFFHPFPLVLQGMDHSHSKGNHGTIWIGIAESAPLIALKKEVNRLIRHLPLQSDDRSFQPHVTLGSYERLNPQRLGDYLMAHAHYQSEPIEVKSCLLMRSLQTPKRMIYEIVEEYFASPLATGDD